MKNQKKNPEFNGPGAPKKVVIYVKEKPETVNERLNERLNQVLIFCERNELIIKRIFVDVTTNELFARPGMIEQFKYLDCPDTKGECECLIVFNASSITRNVADLETFLENLNDRGIEVFSLRGELLIRKEMIQLLN